MNVKRNVDALASLCLLPYFTSASYSEPPGFVLRAELPCIGAWGCVNFKQSFPSLPGHLGAIVVTVKLLILMTKKPAAHRVAWTLPSEDVQAIPGPAGFPYQVCRQYNE